MNKISLLSAIVLSTIPLTTSASTLGFAAGVELTHFDASYDINGFTNQGNESYGISVYFEHPLPLIPNIRFENNSFESKEVYKFNQSNLTAYYNILDSDLVELNAGLGYTKIGQNNWLGNSGALDHDAVNYYVKGEVHLPFTGVSVFGSALGNAAVDYKSIDFKAGAKYTVETPLVKPSLSVGYRVAEYTFDDLSHRTDEISNDGFFATLAIELK